MITTEAHELILNIKKELNKSGITVPVIVEHLKNLRPHFIETKDPTITKVCRLVYEHLERFGTFNVSMPQEEVLDEEGNVVEVEHVPPTTDEERVESLDYLMSLILNGRNKLNRAEIMVYRDTLIKTLKS